MVFQKAKFCSPVNCRGELCYARAYCAQILWMKRTLLDYDLYYDPIKIYCDNINTIQMIKNAN